MHPTESQTLPNNTITWGVQPSNLEDDWSDIVHNLNQLNEQYNKEKNLNETYMQLF